VPQKPFKDERTCSAIRPGSEGSAWTPRCFSQSIRASCPVIRRKYSRCCLYCCGSTNPSREMMVASLRRSLLALSWLKEEGRVSASVSFAP